MESWAELFTIEDAIQNACESSGLHTSRGSLSNTNTQACTVPANQSGPHWLAGAPDRSEYPSEWRSVVCAPGSSADAVLTVEGYVRSANCEGRVPYAVLDVWQASSDADGALYYGCATCAGDNAQHAHGEYYCRGKVKVDYEGHFVFQTVMPGLYDARSGAHIHVRVLQAGETGPAHVTQLYFNASDQGSAQRDEAVHRDIATPFADGISERCADEHWSNFKVNAGLRLAIGLLGLFFATCAVSSSILCKSNRQLHALEASELVRSTLRPADGRGANCEHLCRQYLQLVRTSGSTKVAHNCNTQRHCFHGSCLCVVHHPRAPGIRSLYDGDVLCGRLHGVRRHGRLCQHRTYHGVSDLGFDCGESCGNHFHRANSVAS